MEFANFESFLEIKWNLCPIVLRIVEKSYSFVKVLFENTETEF